MKHLLFKLNPWAQIKFWKTLLYQERERAVKLEKENYYLREDLDTFRSGGNPDNRVPIEKSPDVLNYKSYS